jgi:hypothetical protein
LGNDINKQHNFLKNAKEREKLEVKVVLYATQESFKFICEGTQRFHKIKMSLPDWFEGLSYDRQIFILRPNIPPYQYTIEITVPEWSLQDIDLIRWISGWGKEVKVIEPQQLIQPIQAKGQGIQEIYQDVTLLVCDLKKVNDLIKKKQVNTFISILNSSEKTIEPELVNNQIDINPNRVLQLTLDNPTTLNQKNIEESVNFVKNQRNSKSKVNPQILVYSHSGIGLASEVAIALYTALTQDPELANLRISLTYH